MSDKLRQLKLEMIAVYGDVCWLNYDITKHNPITFHHILEVRNGGKDLWENGALITENAHKYLNFLDYEYHKIYEELNYNFKELNRTYAPPTDNYYEEIGKVLRKVKR